MRELLLPKHNYLLRIVSWGGESIIVIQPPVLMDSDGVGLFRAVVGHQSLESAFELAEILMVTNTFEDNLLVQGFSGITS